MKTDVVRVFCFALAALFVGVMSQAALAQNELFVTNASNNSVTVYNRTVTGNTAPIRTLSGALTGLNIPWALFVDTVNNELVVPNFGGGASSVTVYSRTASGNTAPIRTLSGPLTGLNASLSRLVVDTVNNELVAANSSGSVTVYSRTASGNTAPIRTLSGPLTQLNAPMGLDVDTVNNELVVGNVNSSVITVYSRMASGNTAPTRTLSGALTGLNGPQGLVLDTLNNELVVVNGGSPTVTVYSRTASGNTAPIRTLSGALTGLSQPEWPAVTTGIAPVLPTLSINNVSANEGNSGLTPFTFTVTLSASSASTVTVNFATSDGTATAGSDYVAASGALTFNPGVTTQTITVNVNGDTAVEPNEMFSVNLSAPANATIATGTGTGTIINDDATAPAANLPIPALDPAALMALVALLAALGILHARRRR